MDIQNNTQKETAIQQEQQLNNQDQKLLDTLSNIEKDLASIAYSLDYFVFNSSRDVNKSHPIPD